MDRRLDSTDDDATSIKGTQSLFSTLVLNVIIFLILITLFEINRHFKSIYFPRLQSKFIRTHRVPMEPAWYPFSWLVEIYKVSEEELLRMVGLDAYMMIRYLGICFRAALFLSFFGVVVLVPVYATAGGECVYWNKYTLANVPNDNKAGQLWVPVVFAYVFTTYFCFLFYSEFKNFLEKRLHYLMEGDARTPKQAYYTIMVEQLPAQLRSVESLRKFFESVFPGQVYSVELSLDLGELDSIVQRRRNIRDKLEHAIAAHEASHRRTRPTVWVLRAYYENLSDPLPVAGHSWWANMCGYGVYDAIDHYTKLLGYLNTRVADMQKVYAEQAKKLDEQEGHIRGRLELETGKIVGFMTGQVVDRMGKVRSASNMDNTSAKTADMSDENKSPTSPGGPSADVAGAIDKEGLPESEQSSSSSSQQQSVDRGSITSSNTQANANANAGDALRSKVRNVVESAGVAMETGVGSLAKEAKFAASSALKGALEATRTIELLTLGAHYKTSTTAFVTFKSRVACCTAHQVLLSHEHFTMKVKLAPNPKDILWDNVSIPYRQVTSRTSIADAVLMFGALFWSIIVGLITAWSNLSSISQQKGWTWLQAYQGTQAYQFLNTYLALALLLILLAILPAIFDFISRSYEGIKLESEIQNSIMTRYFYYQLANVFVSVGLGSIAQSLNEIINQPYQILTILGTAVPTFSLYFTQLVILKAFTAVPIELLRVWPLILILSVTGCTDKKKCTRRDLRTGIFADPAMWYGWVYPSILMVLMIMLTYCTMSPLLSPVALVYFAFAYIMYKYQLLYVYINNEQSGGFMWYAVFNRSMVALMGGLFTLFAYLLIRKTFFSGPVYLLMPLPLLVWYFWHICEAKFKTPTMNLSLLSAMELDSHVAAAAQRGEPPPHTSFKKALFRQPSLAEGALKPAAYRKKLSTPSISPSHRHSKSYFGGGDPSGLKAGLIVNEMHAAGSEADVESGTPTGGSGSGGSGGGGNICCSDGNWYDIDPHLHSNTHTNAVTSTTNRRNSRRRLSRESAHSMYSDDDLDADDINEDLFDDDEDDDRDDAREREVNAILADTPTPHSGDDDNNGGSSSSNNNNNTTSRLSFGFPSFSLSSTLTQQQQQQTSESNESTAIEVSPVNYGSTNSTSNGDGATFNPQHQRQTTPPRPTYTTRLFQPQSPPQQQQQHHQQEHHADDAGRSSSTSDRSSIYSTAVTDWE